MVSEPNNSSPTANRRKIPGGGAFLMLAQASDRFMRSYLPDPFVLAILFTAAVFVAGVALTESTPVDMVVYWGEGFWKLLTLAMQFVLVLCTGFILAISPVSKRLMASLARLATTPGGAIVNVTMVALAAAWINWAFGLVVGALYAREMVRHVPSVNYRLLIASAYSGFVIWHGGLGGSIPLLINTPGHFAEPTIGLIPTSQTIFSGYNIFICLAIFITLPFLNRMMGATAEPGDARPAEVEQAGSEKEAIPQTPAARLENSRIIPLFAAALGAIYLVIYFADSGFNLSIDIVNMIFLTLALVCCGTARQFLDGLQEAVKGVGGIVVQFPFYAGIMGMMAASGLVPLIADWFVSIATPTSLPLFTFLSAGIVNIFIPSGGGQWAVQGPVMLQAGQDLGVDLSKIAMAVAWGDAWTNMIQPFWALPALAIAGLHARDIMGYLVMVLLVTGVIIGVGLTFM